MALIGCLVSVLAMFAVRICAIHDSSETNEAAPWVDRRNPLDEAINAMQPIRLEDTGAAQWASVIVTPTVGGALMTSEEKAASQSRATNVNGIAVVGLYGPTVAFGIAIVLGGGIVWL